MKVTEDEKVFSSNNFPQSGDDESGDEVDDVSDKNRLRFASPEVQKNYYCVSLVQFIIIN